MAKSKTLSTRQVIENAERIFHGLRWAHGIVVCPYCGSIHVKEYAGYHYKCNSCKNRFTDKTNTMLHGSKLSVKVWMQAIYEITSDNFISSITLAKKLGINQKSAWLLRLKLDKSMDMDKVLLRGVICMDEMYVGGCLSNYHYRRKLDLLRSHHLLDEDSRDYGKDAIFNLNKELKTPVFGMTDGDKVVLHVCPNPIKKEHVRRLYRRYCANGSTSVSDESKLYDDWAMAVGSELYTNNHHNNQYVTSEGYTSNAIENKFSWFKRGFYSRITHCKYTQLYLNEYCFRYNTRNMTTEQIFNEAVQSTIGKHVTYKQIREYNPLDEVEYKKTRLANERKHNKMMKNIKFALENHIVDYFVYEHKKYTLKDFE